MSYIGVRCDEHARDIAFGESVLQDRRLRQVAITSSRMAEAPVADNKSDDDNVAIVSAARGCLSHQHCAEKRFDSMGSVDHSLIWLKCQNRAN